MLIQDQSTCVPGRYQEPGLERGSAGEAWLPLAYLGLFLMFTMNVCSYNQVDRG